MLCCMQLYVRRHYFYPPSRITQYYDNVTSQVRAETQVSVASKQRRSSISALRLFFVMAHLDD